MLEAERVAKAEALWVIESQSQIIKDNAFEAWKKQFEQHSSLIQGEYGGVVVDSVTNANLPYATRHPALLHSHHHDCCGHQGYT